jgi:hypothetical protein
MAAGKGITPRCWASSSITRTSLASFSSLRRTRFVTAIPKSSNFQQVPAHDTAMSGTVTAGTRFYIADSQETTVQARKFLKKMDFVAEAQQSGLAWHRTS